MLISLSELPETLRNHITALRECVRLALDDFAADHALLRVRYSSPAVGHAPRRFSTRGLSQYGDRHAGQIFGHRPFPGRGIVSSRGVVRGCHRCAHRVQT